MMNAFVLEQVLADDLPGMASNVIQNCGSDSPALYELADAKGKDTESIRKLFLRAVGELGVTLPSQEMAAMTFAREIARKVVERTLTPYVGARRIWREIYTRFPELHQLRVFVGLASEYEDDESHRDEYSQMIADECKNLLQ